VRRLIALGTASVLLALLPAAARPTPVRSAKDLIYQLAVVATASGSTQESTEWVAIASGAWRIETEGRIQIYTPTAGGVQSSREYASREPQTGFYVRTGSPEFLGPLADRSLTRAALRSYLSGTAAGDGIEVGTSPDGRTQLRFRLGAVAVVATIVGQVGDAHVSATDLFEIPPDQITSSDAERYPGELPRLPVRAYWFGSTLSRRSAVIAVEHFDRRTATAAYSTLYELPSAGGKSSALPGTPRPAGEIQVVSQPIRSPLARRAIQAFNGKNGELRYRPWPRTRLTLRTGERATVVPDRSEGAGKVRSGFHVLTKRTLVSATGSFRVGAIPALARRLKPIR
jgi:hypothetical protein